MLDQDAVNRLVESEIQKTVREKINQFVEDKKWKRAVEQEIISHVQDRITARFSNIETVPDLVNTVTKCVEQLFASGAVPEMSDLVDQKLLEKTVDNAVENFVTQTIDNLSLDSAWLNKIERLINQSTVDQINKQLSKIDLNTAIQETVLENRDFIVSHFSANFSTLGISDRSKNLQLTVMDDAVVVESELYTNDISVENNSDFKGDVLIRGDLAVKGRVNVDNETWQDLGDYIADQTYDKVTEQFTDSLIEQMITETKKGVEFNHVLVGDKPLLHDGELAPGITKTNISVLGDLESLTVKDTLHAEDRRLGINTVRPDSALSVWDEEVSVSIGKYSSNTAYIGTSKPQDITIGTNRNRQLVVDHRGGVWVDSLTVGRNSIGHGKEPPNYSGTKGDVVFNTEYKKGSPFAWLCLGDYRWQELRSAE